MTELLIVTVKNPELGKVKTRLAKDLGEERALDIYKKLLEKTRRTVEGLPFSKAIYYSSFVDLCDEWDNDSYIKRLQSEGDIGQRMSNAIGEALSDGFAKVCLIGSDIYEISAEVIHDAFRLLETHDVVVGPAKDGGYYLIGMKKHYDHIFNISKWSTDQVLAETIVQIKSLGLTWTTTDVLSDIDYMEDLNGTGLL